MAASRSEYQLMIRTMAEMQGVDQAKKGFKELGDSAKEAGLSHRELHTGLHLVSEAAGGALGPIGELVHELDNPVLLAGGSAALILELINKRLETLHEQFLKNTEAAREHAEMLDSAFSSAVNKAAAEVSEFETRARRAKEAVDLLAEAEKNAVQQSKDRADAVKSLAEAQEKLTQALIHEQEVLGHFTHAEGDVMRDRAHRRERSAADQAADTQAQEEIDAKKRQRHDEVKNVNDAGARIPGERAASEHAGQMLNVGQGLMTEYQRTLDEAGKTLDEAKAAYDHPTLGQMRDDIARFGGDGAAAAAARKKEMDEAQKAYDIVKGAVDREREKIAQYEREKASADESLKADEDLVIAKRQLVDQLNREITESQTRLRSTQQNRSRTEAVEDETTRTNRRASLEERIMNGTASDDDRIQYEAMTSATGNVRGQSENSIVDRARQLVERLGRQRPQDRSQTDMQQLHRYFDAIEGFMDNTHGSISILADRMESMMGHMAELLSAQQNINARLNSGGMGSAPL